MSKTLLKLIFLAIILIIVQVVGLNHFCLFGVAMAFAYIYLIIHLPLDLNQNWVLTVAFFTGLIIDIFSDTLGMCCLSCTILAALRKPVLRLYLPREEELTDPCPSMANIGTSVFVRYSLTMALLYCVCLYLIDAFSFFQPVRLALRIVGSTLLTWIVLLAVDSIVSRSDEKRL